MSNYFVILSGGPGVEADSYIIQFTERAKLKKYLRKQLDTSISSGNNMEFLCEEAFSSTVPFNTLHNNAAKYNKHKIPLVDQNIDYKQYSDVFNKIYGLSTEEMRKLSLQKLIYYTVFIGKLVFYYGLGT